MNENSTYNNAVEWFSTWIQQPVHDLTAEAERVQSRSWSVYFVAPLTLVCGYALISKIISDGGVTPGETFSVTFLSMAVIAGLIATIVLGRWALQARASAIRRDKATAEYRQLWVPILGYLRALRPIHRRPENTSAMTVVQAAYRITHTAAWNSDLLDQHYARIDLRAELGAVLDAAQDIATVRRTVGHRPNEQYAHQWQIDTDALDRLGAQVQRRADALLQYEATINRIQATLDDIAARQHRRNAAAVVDDLVRRRGGDHLATDIAASRAAEADVAEAAVQEHLRAAHALKGTFDLPFSITR